MNYLIPHHYHSAVITFTGDAYVNLTELCAEKTGSVCNCLTNSNDKLFSAFCQAGHTHEMKKALWFLTRIPAEWTANDRE